VRGGKSSGRAGLSPRSKPRTEGPADVQTRPIGLRESPTGRDETSRATSASALRKERTRPEPFGGSAKASAAFPCCHWCGEPKGASDQRPPLEKRPVSRGARSFSARASSAKTHNRSARGAAMTKVCGSEELLSPRTEAMPLVSADAMTAIARSSTIHDRELVELVDPSCLNSATFGVDTLGGLPPPP